MIASLVAALLQAADPGVAVTATGRVDVAPTFLQVSHPVGAQGEDTSRALEALAARRKEAAVKWKVLGAEGAHVTFGPPSVVRQEAPAAEEAPVLRLKRRKDAVEEERPSVGVSATLTARVPLRSRDAEARLVEVEALKKKIKEAGLLEAPADKETDQPHQAERMRRWMEERGEQTGFEDGFVFGYAAPADEKDRREAAARAMKEARRQAEVAASAAERTLGALVRLEVGAPGGAGDGMDWRYYARQMMMPVLEAADGLLVSPTPDALALTVTLKALFELK